MIIKYNVLKNTTSISVMMMLVMLLMGACSEFDYSEIGDISNQTGSIPRAQRVITIYREDIVGQTGVSSTLKTLLIVPGTVTKPKAIGNTVKGKVTVTATAPTDVGKKADGTTVNAEEIKYVLYYARYGHTEGNITVDGGTSIAGIEKVAKKAASTDAGIVRITGNTALTTTGFVISNLLENKIYRYFIRSIHPDDASKYTDTATRLAFVLNSSTVKVIPHGQTSIGARAFEDNALTSVSIPDSVTSIDAWAFATNALTSVTLSEKLYNKIKDAENLNTVFGDKVTTYQDHTNKQLN